MLGSQRKEARTMARGYQTFSQLKVRKAGGTEELTLTFIDEGEQYEAEKLLRANGFEISDRSPGYKLFRNPSDALRSAEAFCRR
jgi:hypothetical protein